MFVEPHRIAEARAVGRRDPICDQVSQRVNDWPTCSSHIHVYEFDAVKTHSEVQGKICISQRSFGCI